MMKRILMKTWTHPIVFPMFRRVALGYLSEGRWADENICIEGDEPDGDEAEEGVEVQEVFRLLPLPPRRLDHHYIVVVA